MAVTTYTASASQLLRSASVNVYSGGRKKKLNASMLATATGTASNRSPEDRDEQDGEDVEHAEAEDRHEVVEELDRDRHGSDGEQPGYGPDQPVTRRLRARVHRERSVRLWSERCCSAGGAAILRVEAVSCLR